MHKQLMHKHKRRHFRLTSRSAVENRGNDGIGKYSREFQ
jgi:hypothetical protein